MRCEQRTLDDIKAMGGNDADDERRFATAARGSEINLANYKKLVQPWVRAAVSPQIAEWIQKLHPPRLSHEGFGRDTPAMAKGAEAAEKISEGRKPAPQ